MADNVTANAGSGGSVFATDDIAGVHYPFSKLAWGPRDTANEVDKASGKGLPVQGEAAHGATSTGNPVLGGLEAKTTAGTAVTDGQVVRARADSLGKQIVLQGASHDFQTNGSVNFTNTTAADLIAAAGAGVRIAITAILVTNAHATVGTKVTIRDKTTTSRKLVGYAAAAGGGWQINGGGRPLLISDANSAIEAVCGTTGSDVDVSVSGYTIAN